MIYIFDIDGTLADISHRLHHIQKEPKDWRGFFADCDSDAPICEVIEVFQSLNSFGNRQFAVTGRSSEIREKTLQWLGRHGVLVDELYMRKEGDHREDNVVKEELLDKILADYPNEKIGGVFEDRQQVVDMYRARGLRVFQVAPGNF